MVEKLAVMMELLMVLKTVSTSVMMMEMLMAEMMVLKMDE
jgi:hypothetical protein